MLNSYLRMRFHLAIYDVSETKALRIPDGIDDSSLSKTIGCIKEKNERFFFSLENNVLIYIEKNEYQKWNIVEYEHYVILFTWSLTTIRIRNSCE